MEVDVQALATLSRLAVSNSEIEKLKGELPEILDFIDIIQKADVSAIDRNPPLRNVMREDSEPHESGMYTERLLREAPAVKGNRLVVKQVVTRKR